MQVEDEAPVGELAEGSSSGVASASKVGDSRDSMDGPEATAAEVEGTLEALPEATDSALREALNDISADGEMVVAAAPLTAEALALRCAPPAEAEERDGRRPCVPGAAPDSETAPAPTPTPAPGEGDAACWPPPPRLRADLLPPCLAACSISASEGDEARRLCADLLPPQPAALPSREPWPCTGADSGAPCSSSSPRAGCSVKSRLRGLGRGCG